MTCRFAGSHSDKRSQHFVPVDSVSPNPRHTADVPSGFPRVQPEFSNAKAECDYPRANGEVLFGFAKGYRCWRQQLHKHAVGNRQKFNGPVGYFSVNFRWAHLVCAVRFLVRLDWQRAVIASTETG